jgi:VanZ family protein
MIVFNRNSENSAVIRVSRMAWYRFPPLVVYGLICYLSSKPVSDFPSGIPDIIPHVVEFFLLSYFFLRMFRNPLRRRQMVFSFFFLLMLAFLDEIHQLFVPTRVFSLVDLAYDLLGIVSGMLFAVRLKNIAETTQKRNASQVH